jgi:CBS domain-containing protein
MHKPNGNNFEQWIIRSDRRTIALKCFRHDQFLSASEIAQRTGRSIQNISTALRELKERGLIDELDPGQKTWKKFVLTPLGKSTLTRVEKWLSGGMFEQLADEMMYRTVSEAYRLIVKDPIRVNKDMQLHEVVERILAEPRTRSAYVVDDEGRLIGMIALKQMLQAIGHSISQIMDSKINKEKESNGMHFSVKASMMIPPTVEEGELLLSALQKMIESELEDLPVIDENNILIGELNGFEILLLGSEIMRNQVEGD